MANQKGNISKCRLDDHETRKHLLSIVIADPLLSSKQIERVLDGAVGFHRIERLLRPVARRRADKWIIRKNLRPSKNPLKDKVLAILHSLKTMKPLDVAIQHGVTMGTVLGVIRGRYDDVIGRKRRVRVGGTIQFYDDKGYESSGESIKGALEVSTDGNQLKCHECGSWFENLNAHIRSAHKLKTADYKTKHGLKQGSALVGEATRLKLIAASSKNGHQTLKSIKKAQEAMTLKRANGWKPTAGWGGTERRNGHGNCAAQIAYDIRILVDRLRRIPTQKEAVQAGINLDILREKYGTVGNVANIVNGTPLSRKQPTRWYSDEELLKMLKAFGKTHKRPPFQSDCRRGLLPNNVTFAKRFGSWNKALKLAGFATHEDGWIGARHAGIAKKVAFKLGAPDCHVHGSGWKPK